MERITEDEYITGLKAFEVNTLTEVKSKIMIFRGDILEINTQKFRDFYNFLFDINVDAKDNIERKKKKMPLDIVESYFNSLFVSQFKIVSEFIAYLKSKKDFSGLIWDEWRVFLDFVQREGVKFPKDYNVADYYPVIVDDFYYWYCKKYNIKIKKSEDSDED